MSRVRWFSVCSFAFVLTSTSWAQDNSGPAAPDPAPLVITPAQVQRVLTEKINEHLPSMLGFQPGAMSSIATRRRVRRVGNKAQGVALDVAAENTKRVKQALNSETVAGEIYNAVTAETGISFGGKKHFIDRFLNLIKYYSDLGPGVLVNRLPDPVIRSAAIRGQIPGGRDITAYSLSWNLALRDLKSEVAQELKEKFQANAPKDVHHLVEWLEKLRASGFDFETLTKEENKFILDTLYVALEPQLRNPSAWSEALLTAFEQYQADIEPLAIVLTDLIQRFEKYFPLRYAGIQWDMGRYVFSEPEYYAGTIRFLKKSSNSLLFVVNQRSGRTDEKLNALILKDLRTVTSENALINSFFYRWFNSLNYDFNFVTGIAGEVQTIYSHLGTPKEKLAFLNRMNQFFAGSRANPEQLGLKPFIEFELSVIQSPEFQKTFLENWGVESQNIRVSFDALLGQYTRTEESAEWIRQASRQWEYFAASPLKRVALNCLEIWERFVAGL